MLPDSKAWWADTIPPLESGCSALSGAKAKGLGQLKRPVEVLRGTILPEPCGLYGFICQIFRFNLSLGPAVALAGLLRACVRLQREDPRG